ncbi:ankyrin repeat domain-containing protein [Williamsia soli]|uniref:ankyrin repeat domain-containing protein n=1 Tax=Williamsia soli TaxID=364929 RepID=UPI0027DB1308|nr:ankyrin repeat domain-containing protein [Williamsia soli]
MSDTESSQSTIATSTSSSPVPTSTAEPDPALEIRDADGRTPLVAATKSRDTDSARRLILAGADVNAKDNMQDSAFLYAGAEGLDDILVLTLDHGADVYSINRFGGTALIPAAEKGHPTTVQLLIDAGVPLNHINASGWTALLEAVVYGDGSPTYQDIVSRLLAAGADPGIRDSQGRTALQIAQQRGQTDVARLLGS